MERLRERAHENEERPEGMLGSYRKDRSLALISWLAPLY